MTTTTEISRPVRRWSPDDNTASLLAGTSGTLSAYEHSPTPGLVVEEAATQYGRGVLVSRCVENETDLREALRIFVRRQWHSPPRSYISRVLVTGTDWPLVGQALATTIADHEFLAGPEEADFAEAGVFAVEHRRRVIFEDTVSLRAGALRRWRPHVVLDPSSLVDLDE